jgi:Ser/Thr protein kinase RdoA (MazF antagonist)
MPEIPGEDGYDAREPVLSKMVDLLVPLQRDWIGRTDQLLQIGLNDWRPPAVAAAIARTFERNADQLAPAVRNRLARLMGVLDRRLADAAACGPPDTLVHGDFHPGNLRWDGAALTLLDWGDAGVGHPMLDEPAFLMRVSAEDAPRLRERWHAAWRAAWPGADPARASTLLAPIAVLRQAVVYQGFLDHIEPSEHPYHRADPAERLACAADLLAAEQL